MDKSVAPGDHITLAVRPEKIRITLERPDQCDKGLNCLSAAVDEIIYTGFLSKYFVALRGGHTLRVFKQHVNYFAEESKIAFGDKVPRVVGRGRRVYRGGQAAVRKNYGPVYALPSALWISAFFVLPFPLFSCTVFLKKASMGGSCGNFRSKHTGPYRIAPF